MEPCTHLSGNVYLICLFQPVDVPIRVYYPVVVVLYLYSGVQGLHMYVIITNIKKKTNWVNSWNNLIKIDRGRTNIIHPHTIGQNKIGCHIQMNFRI